MGLRKAGYVETSCAREWRVFTRSGVRRSRSIRWVDSELEDVAVALFVGGGVVVVVSPTVP